MTKKWTQKRIVALAGNPNVGKSTLFNFLTGMRQHTGNWPGKTVGIAKGTRICDKTQFCFVDLPGTYSLEGNSEDERFAARYLASREADCTLVVCDGSCLERSLILALQIIERSQRVVVCINLMDEAIRRGIYIDEEKLRGQLGVPVVLHSVGNQKSMRTLMALLKYVCEAEPQESRSWPDPIDGAAQITDDCVRRIVRADRQRKWDRLLVSRTWGVAIMLGILLLIIWLTIWGANYPSDLLQRVLDGGYVLLQRLFGGAPWWFKGILLDGVYATSSRVLSVMLPPMTIFFLLFTILEDVGYLPRMAFLLDGNMRRCGGCGKQALTLCMGLGCNAVGVTGCRIISSPRERLLAILTNAMIPCNGRFPTLILLGTMFFGRTGGAIAVSLCVMLGVLGTMATCGVLSKTMLKHKTSVFLMEMPPFRRPRMGQILVRSFIDRTLAIAGRALRVSAPAGAILWVLTQCGLMDDFAAILHPVASVFGMTGQMLVGYILSFPANELFTPVAAMCSSGAGGIQQISNASGILASAGWSWQMGICCMVFCVFHWPCATTLMSIYKETRSTKKTAAALFLPTAVGLMLCFVLNLLFRIFCG